MNALLSSKSFWSAVFSAIVMVLVTLVPELQPHSDKIITAMTFVTVALISGHKIKDIALAYLNTLDKPTTTENG